MITLERFKERVVEELLNKGYSVLEDEKLEEGIILISYEENKGQINLFNFLDRMNDILRNMKNINPAIEKDVLEDCVKFLHEVLAQNFSGKEDIFDFEKIKNHIYPMIKGQVMFDEQDDDKKIIFETLANGIYCTYVVDTENSMMYITQTILNKWNLKFDEIKELSMNNFKRDFKDKPLFMEENMYSYPMSDCYAATRILLYDNLNAIKEGINGKLLFALPNRDFCIIFSENPKGRTKKIATRVFFDYQTKDYAISPHIYEYFNGKFLKYTNI